MFIQKLSKVIIMVMTSTLMTSCTDVLSANYIGDLGGVPVDLPKNLVHLVEYDGDPAWGKKREGPKPARSYDSKINSFGFDVRYTDNTIRDVLSPPCQHLFDLEPQMALDLSVQYSRHNLADWQRIEQVVRQHILNFRKTS